MVLGWDADVGKECDYPLPQAGGAARLTNLFVRRSGVGLCTVVAHPALGRSCPRHDLNQPGAGSPNTPLPPAGGEKKRPLPVVNCHCQFSLSRKILADRLWGSVAVGLGARRRRSSPERGGGPCEAWWRGTGGLSCRRGSGPRAWLQEQNHSFTPRCVKRLCPSTTLRVVPLPPWGRIAEPITERNNSPRRTARQSWPYRRALRTCRRRPCRRCRC